MTKYYTQENSPVFTCFLDASKAFDKINHYTLFRKLLLDDLSDYLVKSQIGCQIDNVCVNHVMYADDICLMAPSPAALQNLINICYDFSLQSNLTFNSSNSFCMVFKVMAK